MSQNLAICRENLDKHKSSKNGNHIEVEGTVFKILEFQHVKPGKGKLYAACAHEVPALPELDVLELEDLEDVLLTRCGCRS